MPPAPDSASAHPPALVVAGMHRSGTSLAAAVMADAGLPIGEQLMGPATGNVRGHFEDLDFCTLHQRILAANGLSHEGFTCAETILVPSRARAAAADLLGARRSSGRPWGWKDPRTTLFLDLWGDLAPESRFLFMVRPPWEVVDSLFRRGDEAFQLNPRFALDLWVAYNRRVRDFVRGHPDRCAIVETASLAADPHAFLARLSDLLGVPLGGPGAVYEPDLLNTGVEPHRQTVVAAVRPDALHLFDELRTLAGATPATLPPPNPHDIAAAALTEWSAAAARGQGAGAHTTATAVEAELEAARAELARLQTAAAPAQAAVAESQAAAPLDGAATIPFPSAGATDDDTGRSRPHGLEAELAAARAEADGLAEQLQAERENFEALRLDLVGRLERVAARAGLSPRARADRPRRRLDQRIAAECRRFVRRLTDRRRRSA